MARTIPANLQALLDENLGLEPVNLIAVQWTNNGSIYFYADKDISGIDGKILEISGLDNTIVIQGVTAGVSGDSQAISITLDDSDGNIKNIVDTNDIHKQAAWVYQTAEGLVSPTADKALIFKGQVSSPMDWVEGDRTVRFDIITQAEDADVGFSMEEGNFEHVPQDLVGKPWPLIFGTVKECEALRTRSPRQGVLKTGFGIADFVLPPKREQADLVCCPWRFIGFRVVRTVTNVWGGGPLTITPRFRQDIQCQCRKAAIACELSNRIAIESAFEYSTITILDGELFPQGKNIALNIDGAKVGGRFNGTVASPTNVFTVSKYTHPKQLDPTFTLPEIENFGCDNPPSMFDSQSTKPEEMGAESCILTVEGGEYSCGNYGSRFQNYYDNGGSAEQVEKAWNRFGEFREAGFFWADPGAEVTLFGDSEIVYVANLLPSTVHQVKAWKTFPTSNLRRLTTVPNTYYTKRQSDFNEYTTQEIVVPTPLSLLPNDEGWEDDLFVTLTSSVGNNMVDIMEWLINKYTSFSFDSSFATVKTKVEKYPMDFKVPGKMNILDLLQQMAFWNRCALTLRNGSFHLDYLSDVPSIVDTLTESDIIQNTLTLTHTETEDLVTEFTAEWRPKCSLEEPYKYIVRYNTNKYGFQKETFDCFVFRHQTLVDKSAKFWSIRMANTWRKIKCQVPISKLALESIDGINITLPDIADGTVTCRVESAVFNSADNVIDLVIWTPVRSGERTQYDFAYPAGISVSLLHPTAQDLQFGNAGSSGPNVDVTPPTAHVLGKPPSLPQGFGFGQGDPCANISNNNLGGPDLANRCRPDQGDTKPSDTDDEKPADTDVQDDNSTIPPEQSPKQEIKIADNINDLKQEQAEQDGSSSTNGNRDTDNREAQDEADGKDPNDPNEQQCELAEGEDPDDLSDQGRCHWDLTVFYITVKTVTINAGETCDPTKDPCNSANGWCYCSEPAKTGCYVGNVTSNYNETFSFDSEEGRDAFLNSIRDIREGPATVGQIHPVNWTSVDNISAGCPELEEGYETGQGNGGITGYTNSAGGECGDNTILGHGESSEGANDGFGQENWEPQGGESPDSCR